MLTRSLDFQYLAAMKSVIAYTIHKAGSTFLNSLMRQTCRRYAVEHFSINDDRYFETIKNGSWKAFIEETNILGGIGPVRGSTNGPIFPADLDDYNIILHLRDPRDVLTSLFYSCSYSHCVRPGRFEVTPQQREKWQRAGIDKFVLDTAVPLSSTYKKLCSTLMHRPNVTVIHYEQMVLNYRVWLASFLKAFRTIKVPSRKRRHVVLPQFARRMKILSELYRRNKDSFSVDKEDIYSHKRKVTPGDHREKLKDATVAELDDVFADYFRLAESTQIKLAG